MEAREGGSKGGRGARTGGKPFFLYQPRETRLMQQSFIRSRLVVTSHQQHAQPHP